MEITTGPFEEPFQIYLDSNTIAINGDVDGSPEMLNLCRETLSKLSAITPLSIRASNARITPEGVTAWIHSVNEFLSSCELTYFPSELALLLRFDDRYRHSRSQFKEYSRTSTADCEISGIS